MGMSDSQNQPSPSSHFLLPAVGQSHSFLSLYIGLVQKTKCGHSQLPNIVTWRLCLEN